MDKKYTHGNLKKIGRGRYDLIDDFFTQDEMLNADHWLKGEFDGNGFFSGEIKIFI